MTNSTKICKGCGREFEDKGTRQNAIWCPQCRNTLRCKAYRSSLKGGEINIGGEMDLGKLGEQELLEEISKRGYQSTKRPDLIPINRSYKFPRKFKSFKVGVVSDTHFGSIHQQITLLHRAYDIFEKEGIKDVFHCGDVVEGNGRQYKGQIHEMFLHGADVMVDYTINNYPKRKGIKTYAIGGSHDYSFYKEDGTDVLKRIAERRKDFEYLSNSGAYIEMGRVRFYLLHPSGGLPYARSYRMQKVVEQFPSGKKPHILLVGHLHVSCVLPVYRNVAAFQVPCFQGQTQYLRAKGLAPDIGFIILEVVPNKKGVDHYTIDYRPFYEAVPGDY